MFGVPNSTHLFRSDTSDSDASVARSVRTPSHSSDTEELNTMAANEAILKKTAKLERELMALRAEYDNNRNQGHRRSDSRRDGGRKKKKWSSVKVVPSQKTALTYGGKSTGTPSDIHMSEDGAYCRDCKKASPSRGAHARHVFGCSAANAPPTPDPSRVNEQAQERTTIIQDLTTERLERHLPWGKRHNPVPAEDAVQRQDDQLAPLMATASSVAAPGGQGMRAKQNISTAENVSKHVDSSAAVQDVNLRKHLRPTADKLAKPIAFPTDGYSPDDPSKHFRKSKTTKPELEKTATVRECNEADPCSSSTWRPRGPETRPPRPESGCNCDDWSGTPCDLHEVPCLLWPTSFRTPISTPTFHEPSNSSAHGNDSDETDLNEPNHGSDNGWLSDVHDGIAPTDSMLHTTLESSVEEEQATEFLRPPRPFGKIHINAATSLEDAWNTFRLQRYESVDFATLKLKAHLLDNEMDLPGRSLEAASANATIVKHMDETGRSDLRLRWNNDLDAQLLTYVQDGKLWAVELARALSTTVEDCIRRWEEIKHMNRESAEMATATMTATKVPELSLPVYWNTELDEKLMELRNSYPMPSWSDIANELGMMIDAEECRRRFKKIKPEGWRPKTKKQMQKEAKSKALIQETAADASSTPGAVGAKKPTTFDSYAGTGGIGGIGNDYGRGESDWSIPDEIMHIIRSRDCGCEVGAWSLCDELVTKNADCWGNADYNLNWSSTDNGREPNILPQTPCPIPGSRSPAHSFVPYNPSPSPYCEFGSEEGSVAKSEPQPQPQPAASLSYTVTYWATIESGGEEIYVPIDSKNVSGPEKSIANGGMQKVWKWVHDKGLSDKIGLQDAFDLAQSVHEADDAEKPDHKEVPRRAESRMSAVSMRADTESGCW